MDAVTILNKLDSLGISVEITGDRLLLEPGSRVPLELVDELKARKQEIILKLKGYREKYLDAEATDKELDEIAIRIRIEGYVLLWSNVLCDLVAFYKGEEDRAKIPPGFVPYSLNELKELFGKGKQITPQRLRLIHEAKREGCHIVGETPDKQDRNRGKAF
jgi:hypothetical protein